jgi:uncharacterized membrane protein
VTLSDAVEAVGKGVDLVGIAIIVVGTASASVGFVARSRAGRSQESYSLYRRSLGRAILLGLEFLVAGDIIRTVAITPTFAGVGVLGLIVLIRTFLSVALQVETEGRWPWHPRDASRSPGVAG